MQSLPEDMLFRLNLNSSSRISQRNLIIKIVALALCDALQGRRFEDKIIN
jgi:hypothetical protein